LKEEGREGVKGRMKDRIQRNAKRIGYFYMKFEKLILIVLAIILITKMNGVAKSDQPINSTPMITVAAVGDVMMGTDYPSSLLPEKEGSLLFNESKIILRKADIVFCNLEGPLYDGGFSTNKVEKENVYFFRTPTRFAKNLIDAGFNAISLSNNHAEDFGREGLASTKRVLKNIKIKYSSKGGEVAKFKIKGGKIGLVAFSFGLPPRSILYPEKVLKEVKDLSKKYDILIISVHGGTEGKSALKTKNEFEYFLGGPRGNLVEFAHQAIERGADLILGHGPHVPRAMEVYQDRLIAYSLGNFCTYERMSLDEEKGYAPLLWVELDRTGKFIKGKIYSFIQIPPGGPKKDEEQRAWTLMKKLSQEDFPETSPYFGASEMIFSKE
jgi:poly-gamma-glutamate capsule biosynthesis protein CapA/YwtB (metallophosphatase superfamily)